MQHHPDFSGRSKAAKSIWAHASHAPSLSEAFRSVHLPGRHEGLWRRIIAFSGPGFLVAVGYMDPGNWATDLAAGSAFGYRLLGVVLLASLMAMVLQTLSARLGVATGRDLAQACRDAWPRPVSVGLWLLAEIGICACDLAEILGTALGLNLLFHIPLLWGVCLTILDVLVILSLQRAGFRWIETMVITLIVLVASCFLIQLFLARPDLGEVASGLTGGASLLHDSKALYLATGILGATIMPHNLYLHSALVQTRRYELSDAGRNEATTLAGLTGVFALILAMLVNAAILVLAAAAFHTAGLSQIADISQAHHLLTPLLGGGAGVLFAMALLAAGQNSAITATLAGQIVMEGFIAIKVAPWLRRVITRALAAVPAIIVVAATGEAGLGRLLILSQVVLSIQLPFAVVPLVIFTADRRRMGALVNPLWLTALAWVITAAIVLLNLGLLLQLA
ncbi:MAG: divalent metal cation transporter [Caulobacteraceae bacterium]|nr:divalent metal cation transporter [Caulobacteraceae bacterium]